MARHGTMQFLPAVTGVGILPIDQIPDDVKKDAEDAIKQFQTAEGRLRVEFDSKAEALKWCREMDSYCKQRPGGALRFRRSPTKNLPDNVVDFRINDDLEENAKRRAENGKGNDTSVKPETAPKK